MLHWWIDPNVVGLAYDAAGILVFGAPAIFASNRQILAASESTWDHEVSVIRLQVEQKWDHCVGSILLALGFAFQIVATQDWYFLNFGAIALWAALPVISIGYIATRSKAVERHVQKIIAADRSRSESQ